ncbi:winged helix-turn-helix transcriptional regulator [Methanobrevibacter millerae]
MSTKVLHQTLTELESVGLIDKKIIQEKPKLTECSLTEKGNFPKS